MTQNIIPDATEQTVSVFNGYCGWKVTATVRNIHWGNGGRTLYGTVTLDGVDLTAANLRANYWQVTVKPSHPHNLTHNLTPDDTKGGR